MEESKGVGRSGGAAMAHETVPTINTTTNNHKTLTHVVQQDNNITNRNSSSHNYYTGFVDEKKLVPIVGVCCFLFSFYSEYPHCIGFSSKNSILCAKNRVVFLKPGRNTEGCCVCLAVECLFIHFDTVCKVGSALIAIIINH